MARDSQSLQSEGLFIRLAATQSGRTRIHYYATIRLLPIRDALLVAWVYALILKTSLFALLKVVPIIAKSDDQALNQCDCAGDRAEAMDFGIVYGEID